MKMNKFHCVDMKRQGAEKVMEKTSQMTMAQELEFWGKRTQNLKSQQKSVKQKRHQSVTT